MATLIERLRKAGWSVAVHNDYKLYGKPHTFWLLTRGDFAIKGEAETDKEALEIAMREAARIEDWFQANQHVPTLHKEIAERKAYTQTLIDSYVKLKSEHLAATTREAALVKALEDADKALEPFARRAKVADYFEDKDSSTHWHPAVGSPVTVRDLRAASTAREAIRTALAAVKEPQT